MEYDFFKKLKPKYIILIIWTQIKLQLQKKSILVNV